MSTLLWLVAVIPNQVHGLSYELYASKYILAVLAILIKVLVGNGYDLEPVDTVLIIAHNQVGIWVTSLRWFYRFPGFKFHLYQRCPRHVLCGWGRPLALVGYKITHGIDDILLLAVVFDHLFGSTTWGVNQGSRRHPSSLYPGSFICSWVVGIQLQCIQTTETSTFSSISVSSSLSFPRQSEPGVCSALLSAPVHSCCSCMYRP